jgi:hypothetical protein
MRFPFWFGAGLLMTSQLLVICRRWFVCVLSFLNLGCANNFTLFNSVLTRIKSSALRVRCFHFAKVSSMQPDPLWQRTQAWLKAIIRIAALAHVGACQYTLRGAPGLLEPSYAGAFLPSLMG